MERRSVLDHEPAARHMGGHQNDTVSVGIPFVIKLTQIGDFYNRKRKIDLYKIKCTNEFCALYYSGG